MLFGKSKSSPPLGQASQETRLMPVVVYGLALLASWSVWAVSIYPRIGSVGFDESAAVGLMARLTFWGIPSLLYLYRYWGKRALEPLGLTFPLGTAQWMRTLLITLVVGGFLFLGTAAQAELTSAELARRLWDAPSVDWSAPILEELVFRGIVVAELLNWTHDSSRTPVELRLKFWGGQLGGAGLFVAIHWPYWVSHFGVEQALSLSFPVLVTGLILGFVFATTRSIWGCIALHGLNNALSQVI